MYIDGPAGLFDGNAEQTIAFWIFLDDPNIVVPGSGAKVQIIACEKAWDSWFGTLWYGRMDFFMDSANGTLGVARHTMYTNQWVHVAFVYDGFNCSLFMDGRKVQSDVCPQGGMAARNKGIYIGTKNDVEGYTPFRGYLDELMIFDKALNEYELSKLSPMGCGDGICTGGLEHVLNCPQECFDYGLLTESTELVFWWADSMMKVFPQQKPPTVQAPAVLKLARSETRIIQVAISGKSGIAKQSALSISSTSNAGDHLEVTLYVVGYIPILNGSRVTMPTEFQPRGPVPDVCWNRTSVDVNADETVSVIVEVKSSNLTAPGSYNIEVKIGSTSVPISIVVYNFELPKMLSLKSSLGVTSPDMGMFVANSTCSSRSRGIYHGADAGMANPNLFLSWRLILFSYIFVSLSE